MDRDVVMHQMHVLSREGTERFEELYAKALDAVEQAPDGPWISAGEFAFLEVFRELMRESFEAALQARIDTHSTATAATFSPSEPGDRGSAAAAAQRLALSGEGNAPGCGAQHRG